MHNDKNIDKSLIIKALTAIAMTEKPGFRIHTLVNGALYDTYHDNPEWQGFFINRDNQIRNEHRYFFWAVTTIDGNVHYYMYCTPDTYTRKYLHSMLHNRGLADSDDNYRILVLGDDEYIIRYTNNIGLDMPSAGWRKYNTNTMMSNYVADVARVLHTHMSYIGEGITSKIAKRNRKKIKKWLKNNALSTNYPKRWTRDEIELAKELQSKAAAEQYLTLITYEESTEAEREREHIDELATGQVRPITDSLDEGAGHKGRMGLYPVREEVRLEGNDIDEVDST